MFADLADCITPQFRIVGFTLLHDQTVIFVYRSNTAAKTATFLFFLTERTICLPLPLTQGGQVREVPDTS